MGISARLVAGVKQSVRFGRSTCKPAAKEGRAGDAWRFIEQAQLFPGHDFQSR
jgi:hypothetical protein